MATCFEKCYDVVENKIGSVFSRYGKFVARHPWKIIITAVLVNGLLGIGMIRLNVVIDVERVYTPIGSQASKDGEKVSDLFPDLSGSNFIGYQMPDMGRYGEVIVIPKGGNILNAQFLTQLKTFHTFLLSIGTSDNNGKTVKLTDICAKSLGSCAIDGDLFVDDQFIAHVNSSHSIPFPYYNHTIRGLIYYEQNVGGAVVSSNTLQAAPMLLMRVNLRKDSDYFTETAKKWQDSFLAKMKGFSSNDFNIVFSHSDSLSEELNENVIGDITIFSITFTLMITYACVATLTARCDVVGQRANLGFAGVIAAGLAIVAAFGLCSACGVEFVSIVGVIPFLIIGIGVDDMFMLMSGITNTNYGESVEDRIGETMKTSGISITITSLTDLFAFAAGTSSVFLSVRNFCIYAGVAVVFCYINQATIFLASIAINENRTNDNRHFLTCLIVPTPDKEPKKTSCHILCCKGRKPENSTESESFLDKFPGWILPKIISVPAKVIILILFSGYLSVSIWGVTLMEEGLEMQNLVSQSSYYYKYREFLDKNFPLGTPVSFVFDNRLNYSDISIQEKINDLLLIAKAENTIKNSVEINWFTEYKNDALHYMNSTESDFIKGLQSFLSLTSNARFRNDVVIDKSNSSIIASRIHVMSESIKESQEQGKFMQRMRDLASDRTVLPVFAFSPAFLFYEQYVIILSQTLQTLGIAVAMVFFITFIFMPHPLLLLYITTTVAMITVGIFGSLPFLDLTLSSITMIHIIMSIGFSVDFAAHICHGYMISKGKDRNERMKEGLRRSGTPIFHGAISSILGVIILAAAKSYIFFSFFKVMIVVITVGILHALFLLPVILSLVGPPISSGTVAPDSVSREQTRPENDNVSNKASGTYEDISKQENVSYERIEATKSYHDKALELGRFNIQRPVVSTTPTDI
ncbi:patched domain-containing protein 3-like [Mercenaria mercenaria]|uniref:patched domain-containing protein 3-like n=1 Tax=Mercenaria mercenaria TaxID=6596 RepID=UPI00234E4EE0|nr:patched domain-containing protein 3-like [Mercenaria mercenaria]XP_053399174.1 patched domain-containing protein 3-like [Mercenaria mercenaria]